MMTTTRETLNIDGLESLHHHDITYSIDCDDGSRANRFLRDYTTRDFDAAVYHLGEYVTQGAIGISAWHDGSVVASWTYTPDASPELVRD